MSKLKLFSQVSEKPLMKTILLLSFLINTYAYADCTPKDLTDPAYLKSVGKENLIDHFSKPRDQDSVGWCGAYATTDSLSFSVGEAISAVDVSLNQYANEKKDGRLQDMSGISILSATNVAKKNGYCPESVIPSDQTSSSNLGHQAILNMMASFQKIADDFKAKGKPQDYCVQCSTDQFEKVIKPTLPNATGDMIREVLIQNEGDSLKSIRALMDRLCEGKRKIAKPDTDLIYTSGKNVSKILDEALDNESMPSIGMSTSFFATDESVPGGHGPHEMMIVARRPGADGKCEYLVRNSWGRSCAYYRPEIKNKCDPAKGSFWMNNDQLQSGVTDVVVVKNASKNEVKPKPETEGSAKESKDDRVVTRRDNSQKTKVETKDSSKDTTNNNHGFNNPFSGMDFGDLLKNILMGISAAVSSIWQAFANMFKY